MPGTVTVRSLHHNGVARMSEEIDELRLAQIRIDIARKTQELLYEPRKFRIQFWLAIAASVVAGAAAGGFVVNLAHAPQQIVIHLQSNP
jgi:hypothetical protein